MLTRTMEEVTMPSPGDVFLAVCERFGITREEMEQGSMRGRALRIDSVRERRVAMAYAKGRQPAPRNPGTARRMQVDIARGYFVLACVDFGHSYALIGWMLKRSRQAAQHLNAKYRALLDPVACVPYGGNPDSAVGRQGMLAEIKAAAVAKVRTVGGV